MALNFTNTSGATCTLYGYPGVAFAGSNRAQIGAPAARVSIRPKRLITLQAGQTGSATLRIPQAENYPAAKCRPVPTSYLQVFPPNQTSVVYVPYKSVGCSTQMVTLSIGTVVFGTGG